MTDGKHFSGEDENAGFASPAQDLIAAAVLVMLSLWVMIESLRLDNPGGVATAPGLLPFLTAGSLGVMAICLGSMAMRRHRLGVATVPFEEKPDHWRTALLVSIIVAYLISLETISFEYTVQIGGVRLGYGAFEALTTIALTIVLSIFWRKPLWLCLVVSAVWTTALAAAFRYAFTIPLPGSA